MSAEASGYVWRHSPYTGTKFAIHLAIADTVNDGHQNKLWMSSDQIALKSRAHRRTVQRVIDEMVEDGFLISVQAATQHYPAVYEFVFKQMPQVWISTAEARGDISSLRGDISSTRDDISSPRGGDTPPELNITKENKKKLSPSSVDDEFPEFWKLYPRKIGKDGALISYRRARKKAKKEDILAGLHLYLLTCPKEKHYIAHPTTWLNQGRWADETDEPMNPEPEPETPNPYSNWEPCGNCHGGWIYQTDDRGYETAHPCICRP